MNFDVNDKTSHPRRQVHLDFHTSPDLTAIGSKFSKEDFQASLKTGHVSSITLFAKCHHGLCYYPTKVGTMHPGLDFDLLGAQMEACHEIGVRAPVYITAGWSDLDAKAHPEWLARRKDGSVNVNPLKCDDESRPYTAWTDLCLNDNGYCQHIYQLTEEICRRYDKIDGLFYDICFMGGVCYCDECRRGMAEAGLDPEVEADARRYFSARHIDFMKKCKAILDKYHKNATIFFNSGGADVHLPQYHPHSTHFEMENLPTAWGGYDKIPLTSAYFNATGKYAMGMTGKFHLDWGEFGGFKCPEALKYEVATMATYGVGCSVGDHLFHDGEMDPQTYEYIGHAYEYLEKIEPYCYGGKSCATVGLFVSHGYCENTGMTKILAESQIDFNVIRDGNFRDFDVVVFPDECTVTESEISALKEYVEDGGKVIFCGTSLIRDGKFLIDCGLTNPALPDGDGDYIKPTTLGGVLPKSPFFSYLPSVHAEITDGEVFAETYPPCFNRTYAHFCGHKNSPYEKDGKTYPAVVKKGNVVYVSHPIATIYDNYGSLYHKRYFVEALKLLSPTLAVEVSLGAQGRVHMIDQPDESRYCINMTYACPVRRGSSEVIEDILPIYNIDFTLRTDRRIKRVYLPLHGRELEFVQAGDTVTFTLDRLECHETVVAEYEA